GEVEVSRVEDKRTSASAGLAGADIGAGQKAGEGVGQVMLRSGKGVAARTVIDGASIEDGGGGAAGVDGNGLRSGGSLVGLRDKLSGVVQDRRTVAQPERGGFHQNVRPIVSGVGRDQPEQDAL